jgi:hypothetical protein
MYIIKIPPLGTSWVYNFTCKMCKVEVSACSEDIQYGSFTSLWREIFCLSAWIYTGRFYIICPVCGTMRFLKKSQIYPNRRCALTGKA